MNSRIIVDLAKMAFFSQQQKSKDAMDEMATTALDNDNNNSLGPLLNVAKHHLMFAENNVMKSDSATPLTLNGSKCSSKAKSLDQTIKTLKQNADASLLALRSNDYYNEKESNCPDNILSYWRQQAAEPIPNRSNYQKSKLGSALTADIVCNEDGTAYIIPSKLSSKLLKPGGALIEPGNDTCPSFPTYLKQLTYYNERCFPPRAFSYSVTNLQEISRRSSEPSSSSVLYVCCPCRLTYQFLEQLLEHGKTVHNLTSALPEQELFPKLSAVIQKVKDHPHSLSFLKEDIFTSFEALALCAKEALPNGSNSDSSSRKSSAATSTPPLPTNGLPSTSNGKASPAFCDDHPEGGIECPKCDLVLSSTRSLGGGY